MITKVSLSHLSFDRSQERDTADLGLITIWTPRVGQDASHNDVL